MKCSTHPRYEAKRKPTGDCKECHKIWEKKNEK